MTDAEREAQVEAVARMLWGEWWNASGDLPNDDTYDDLSVPERADFVRQARAVIALCERNQEAMRERCAEVVSNRHPWMHGEGYGEGCVAAIRALPVNVVVE